MTPERWLQVKRIVTTALERPGGGRATYVTEQCGPDAELRLEVESLLVAQAEMAPDFLETPPVAFTDVGGAPDPWIGRPLGLYRIERLLGRGGMGTVYLASCGAGEDERRVALKMMSPRLDQSLVLRRFQKEREILASLDHPNIARLLDAGTTEVGLPYFVMEYVEGQSLLDHCAARGLDTPDRLRLVVDVCAAVGFAHARNVIHRDIKPSNVMVTSDGVVKLLDFGIARIVDQDSPDGTMTTTLGGRAMTPDYASPEQVRGERASVRSDIYSLGVVLYELLTGRRPYRLKTHTAEELARAICEQDPAKPSSVPRPDAATEGADAIATAPAAGLTPVPMDRELTGPLDAIVLKALRKDPEQRYASAAQLADDVEACLQGRRVGARRGAFRYGFRRYLDRHRTAAVALGLSGLVAVATVLAMRAWSGRAPASASVPAEGTRATAARASLAVLGFKNLSGDPDLAWLSTALSEMLTTELAVGEQLRVVPVETAARVSAEPGLLAADGLGGEALARLGINLGSDLVLSGSYAAFGSGSSRQIRLDVRLQNAARGETVATLAETGREADLFALVSSAGAKLRRDLGIAETPLAEVSQARAAFPVDPQATRLYAEGLAALRVFDAVAARPLLEKASALDPKHPQTHAALAAAWSALGYDTKASAEARRAFELSKGLPREERLSIEGRHREAEKQWDKAVETYRTLWGYFSDNVEYGLRLAAVQVRAGKPAEALVTVSALRALPTPSSEDPRIDLAEVDAHAAVSDYKAQRAGASRAAQRARARGTRLLLAKAMMSEGQALFQLGKGAEAEAAIREARSLYHAVGDRAGEAFALASLATIVGDRGRLADELESLQQALATSQEIGDKRAMSSALNNLGIVLKDQRRYAEALDAHRQALALRREIGDRSWTAISLSNIGVVYFEQNRLSDAARYYRESFAICREIGDRRGLVRALHNLSIVLREQGDLAGARKGYEESLAMRREIGDKRGQCVSGVELGVLMLLLGDLGSAERITLEVLALSRGISWKQPEAQALHVLGDIAAAKGELAEARKSYGAALAVRREIGETRTVVETQAALAEVAQYEGRDDEAEALLRSTLSMVPDDAPAAALSHVLLARMFLKRNQVAEAAQELAPALALAGGSELGAVKNYVTLESARVDAAQGRLAPALHAVEQVRTASVRSGARLYELEARLAQVEIERAAGQLAAARTHAVSLRKDAVARGFVRIASRASQALAGAATP
ncbi:MAG: protein kinase [Solirubrobacterales bacterium]